MRYFVLSAALACAAIAAPAQADVPYAVTPSGRAEAVFDTTPTQTSDRIANGCADMGWTLVNTTETMVVCEARFTTFQSILSALTMGNKYSTPPKQLIRFNITGLGSGSRAQATGWMETQMAFGQTQTQAMDSAHYHNSVMNLFMGVGGHFPGGTTFPNHAHIGLGFEEVESPTKGLLVRSIEPGSAAENAGILEGDIITRIAKERIKGGSNLLDGLRKAVKAETYDVELDRGGKSQTVSVSRLYRSAADGIDLSAYPVEETSATMTAALSPADELAKFAKLRNDGIITEEEFQAKKAQLLAN